MVRTFLAACAVIASLFLIPTPPAWAQEPVPEDMAEAARRLGIENPQVGTIVASYRLGARWVCDVRFREPVRFGSGARLAVLRRSDHQILQVATLVLDYIWPQRPEVARAYVEEGEAVEGDWVLGPIRSPWEPPVVEPIDRLLLRMANEMRAQAGRLRDLAAGLERLAQNARGQASTLDDLAERMEEIARSIGGIPIPEPLPPIEPPFPPGQAFLGVSLGPDDDLPGVLVEEVIPGSGAAAAGVEPGDRILAVGDRSTGTRRDLLDALTYYRPGQTVTVTIDRDGWRRLLTVRLGERG